MKILLIGDSITDMHRVRSDSTNSAFSFGSGYPFFIEGELGSKFPHEHTVINRGIGGDRVVDIYARIKRDCWNYNPDLISIFVGVNDVWHEIGEGDGVDLERYEKIYDMLIEDTKKVLPNVKLMLVEPYVIKGSATENDWERFEEVYKYAKVVEKLAKKHNCYFVPLQKKLSDLSQEYGGDQWLIDGVHPLVPGAKVIADSWLEEFYKIK